jgi:hypothetical protein
MKIVINRCFGGFGLSEAACDWMTEHGVRVSHDGISAGVLDIDLERNNPTLVACVEALGDAADTPHSALVVVEIPDDVRWHISDYDGRETVEEDHRSWS